MIFRRATLEDTGKKSFRDLVLAGLYSGDLGIQINKNKLFAFCESTTKLPHYGAIAEQDGEFVAYIGGLCGEHYWLERQQFNIVGWYSTRPGAGMKLLDMALRWAKSVPYIKTTMISVNPDVADRVSAVFKRRGIAVHVAPSFLIEV